MGLDNKEKDGASAMELSPVERALNTVPVATTLLQDFLPENGRQRLVKGLEAIWKKMEPYKRDTADKIPTLERFKHFIGEDTGMGYKKRTKRVKEKEGKISRLILDLRTSMRNKFEDELNTCDDMTEEEKKALLEKGLQELQRQKYSTLTRGVNNLVRKLWETPIDPKINEVKHFYHQTGSKSALNGISQPKRITSSS